MYIHTSEDPSTQDLRFLVPNTIQGMVFGTRSLRYYVLGPSGYHSTGHFFLLYSKTLDPPGIRLLGT